MYGDNCTSFEKLVNTDCNIVTQCHTRQYHECKIYSNYNITHRLSLFSDDSHVQMIPFYRNFRTDHNVCDKLAISVVGDLSRTKQDILKKITYDNIKVTHYYRSCHSELEIKKNRPYRL